MNKSKIIIFFEKFLFWWKYGVDEIATRNCDSYGRVVKRGELKHGASMQTLMQLVYPSSEYIQLVGEMRAVGETVSGRVGVTFTAIDLNKRNRN